MHPESIIPDRFFVSEGFSYLRSGFNQPLMYRLIFFFLFASSVLSAQTVETQPDIFRDLEQLGEGEGRVYIEGEDIARELVNLHINLNRKHSTFTGYRIQIFSGNPSGHSMEKLQELKDAFAEAFPDIPVYLNYYDPDFKIRAGNFRNKLESIPALKRIRHKYPSAYPVKMEIPVRDLHRLAHPEEEEENNKEEEEETAQGLEENSMF